MNVLEILLIGVGLSMDAFAVSICKGLCMQKMDWKKACIAGLYFGGFQALMPLLGWLLGSGFSHFIENIDHWIVFVILTMIGIGMVRDAIKDSEEAKDKEKCDVKDADFSPKTMLPMAIATSIDALAVGVSFAFLKVNIWLAILLIGCTTFGFGVAGVKIGQVFGAKFRGKAEAAGGIILILIGLKILLEHLGILSF